MNNNNFSTIFKTFAFPPELLNQLDLLNENYGHIEKDGNLEVRTIACGWDDSSQTRLRALRFPETVSLTPLIDGRYAYTALWSNDLISAITNGEFSNVEELTQEKLLVLLIPEIETENSYKENQE